MIYLISIVGSIALFAGFLALTRFEHARGTRYMSVRRERLDAVTGRALFIVRNVDFASLVRAEMTRALRRVSHILIAASLQGIRAVERVLTRLIRRLRAEGGVQHVRPDRPSGRQFISALTDFKARLSSHRFHKKRGDSESSPRALD